MILRTIAGDRFSSRSLSSNLRTAWALSSDSFIAPMKGTMC